MKKILLVAGARPNFIKIAPILEELKKTSGLLNKNSRLLQYAVVHTGQHYDFDMSQTFFRDLGIVKPKFFMCVGSGSHAYQTAQVLLKSEELLIKYKPDLVIVVGDVNSTLGCVLAASKIPNRPLIAHVEAGLRSRDRSMPEEVNRILVDSLSDLLFTTCVEANKNLKKEGIDQNKIFFVGNVMIDTLIRSKFKIKRSEILKKLGLKEKGYALVTLHRPVNVDDENMLRGIFKAIIEINKHIPVVLPVHPRTLKKLEIFGIGSMSKSLKLIRPQGYLDFLKLSSNANFVLTDSGGVQEETTYLGIPCLTMRENTERPITIDVGTNMLIGSNPRDIVRESMNIIKGQVKRGKIPDLWDGKAAQRIAKVIVKKIFNNRNS